MVANLSRRRHRGWLYVAMQGPDADVATVTVCRDFLSALLVLADQPDGDIGFCSPDQGGPLRRWIEGGPRPLPIKTQWLPVNLVSRISERSQVSRPTVRAAVHSALRQAPGVGGQIFRAVEAIGRIKFSELTGGPPL